MTKRKKSQSTLKKVITSKSGEITLDILECIASIPEALLGSFLNRNDLYHRYGRPDFLASRFFDHLRSMAHTGYVEIKRDNSSCSVCLTKKGKIKLLEESHNNLTDGNWRFLSFDIPESQRKIRNQFRRSIRRIGFKQIQKSLWACPFIKADEIDLLIGELNIRKYVGYFSVYKTDLEPHLRILFKQELFPDDN